MAYQLAERCVMDHNHLAEALETHDLRELEQNPSDLVRELLVVPLAESEQRSRKASKQNVACTA